VCEREMLDAQPSSIPICLHPNAANATFDFHYYFYFNLLEKSYG